MRNFIVALGAALTTIAAAVPAISAVHQDNFTAGPQGYFGSFGQYLSEGTTYDMSFSTSVPANSEINIETTIYIYFYNAIYDTFSLDDDEFYITWNEFDGATSGSYSYTSATDYVLDSSFCAGCKDYYFFSEFVAFEAVAQQPGTYKFSIDAAGTAPEPAEWALLVLGFGSVGAALRQRQRRLNLE